MLIPTIFSVALNEYIVQYQQGSNVQADIQIGDHFKASIVQMSREQALKRHKDAAVKRVEKNNQFQLFDVQSDPPSWGLDRVDSRAGLDGKYHYPSSAGKGVTAYIIDTGINIEHIEFEGRAEWGFDATGEGEFDGFGHGSHVAGTIGGKTFGIAKKVNLVAVKAFTSDGMSRSDSILKAIEWATKDALNRKGKSVANMSFGTSKSDTINDAIAAAVKTGLTMVAAAGNYNDDACHLSPASAPEAITVGAVDKMDNLAYFSNWGSCVDINAPGVDITSAWNGSNNATLVESGTSMAAPHIVGIVALYFGEGSNVDEMISNASKDVINGLTGKKATTKNLFVYNQVKQIINKIKTQRAERNLKLPK